MEILLKPVAWVINKRQEMTDDFWGDIVSEIILDESVPETAFNHIVDFSHLEIIYYFDRVTTGPLPYVRRPRGNPDFPEQGIFAQRNKDRPNHLGLSTVELVWHRERSIGVKFLDAKDGTPILDIKPVFREFSPQGEIRQPVWVSQLLRDYWGTENNKIR